MSWGYHQHNVNLIKLWGTVHYLYRRGAGRIWGWVMTFLMSWKGGGHNFFDELKGWSSVFCSFIFKSSFSMLIFGSIKPFLTKIGNKIEYLMPTKYNIFLRKGHCPLQPPLGGQSSGLPSEHFTHSLSSPQFKMEWRPCNISRVYTGPPETSGLRGLKSPHFFAVYIMF